MKKISARLEQKMADASAGVDLQLIVTLFGKSDWVKGLDQLKAAGFRVESSEEAVRAVFGKASAAAVRRMAELPEVALVELDGKVEALD
jgi:hypothetical protein